MSAVVYSDLAIGLAKKNYLEMTPDTLKSIHWIRKEVMKMSFSMSADVYSDLTIRLALKNYPKMTLKLPKSIHWFKRYIEIIFYII